MHIVPQDSRAEDQSGKIPLSQLWRDNDLALPEMQEVREALQLSKMRICWSLGASVGPSIFEG